MERRSNRRSRVHHRALRFFQSRGRRVRRTVAGLSDQRKNDSVKSVPHKLQVGLTKPAAAPQFLLESEMGPIPAPPTPSAESKTSAPRRIARSTPHAPRYL